MKLYGMHESGDAATTDRIRKEGPERQRAMMIQYARASIKGPGRFQRFYKRFKRHKGAGKAKVATAKRMMAIVFVLVTRGCEYVEVDELGKKMSWDEWFRKLMRERRLQKPKE